jgi:glycosyltransferase involved in cell wall biosynthesis
LPSREESFPQAALEAMAMSLPVIAAEVGGVSELVKNEINGLLVPKGDIQFFSNALNRFQLDPKAVFNMGSQAKITALKFSEKAMVEHISAIYHELLAIIKKR